MFNNIIGNDKIKNDLISAVRQNKCSHSYLFIGTEGIGKSLIAKEFAKMILCLEKDKYCDECKSCIEFDSNNNPDFKEIKPLENSIKIEQIREMQRRIVEQPIISDKKVYLIDDADLLTKEAQNCLLKTLEEPPKFATIILIGSNESKFLSTIKSRCTIIKFKSISLLEIEQYLKQKYELNEIPSGILEASNGSIGKAENIINKQDLYKKIYSLLKNIETSNLIETLKNADIIYKSQEDKFEILDYFTVNLFNTAKHNLKYLNCIKFVEETKKRLNANSNYNMSIDNMIISIWEEIH